MQVVIIAAGYDTRAYRLHRPDIRFYEIDLPHASQKKQDLVRDLLTPASKVGHVTNHGPNLIVCLWPNFMKSKVG